MSNKEVEMSKRVTRRSALSLFGLAVLSLAVPPTVLSLSDAEAEEAAPKTGTKKAAPKTGTERRQDRRKGREKKRKERQKQRKDRRTGGEKSGEKGGEKK